MADEITLYRGKTALISMMAAPTEELYWEAGPGDPLVEVTSFTLKRSAFSRAEAFRWVQFSLGYLSGDRDLSAADRERIDDMVDTIAEMWERTTATTQKR